MCGLAGILSNETLASIKKKSNTLSDGLRHRGPDDKGENYVKLSTNFNLSLIHRRLSIIDLSKIGQQPMRNTHNNNLIIFNGEIYNYKILRSKLIEEGYKFYTQTDTEVLLYAYDKWGLQMLDFIEGIFAFALFDNNNEEIFIAVDHLGIKPIYWGEDKNSFFFASELLPLVNSNLVKKKLNMNAINSFLNFGSIIGPETIISNLNLLEGGHYIRINNQGNLIEKKKYWELDFTKKTNTTYSQIIEKLDSTFKKVIKEQLISDAPIGLFLSSGIDSNILSIYASYFQKSLNTLTISFDEKKYSEEEQSSKVAKKLGTNHRLIKLKAEEIRSKITESIGYLDQPSIDGINTYFITQAAKKEGIKVALSGIGADEIFAGYNAFRIIPLILKINIFLKYLPASVRKIFSKLYLFLSGYNKIVPNKISQLIAKEMSIEETYFLVRELFPKKTRQEILNTNFSDNINFQNVSQLDILDQISYFEVNTYLKNTLLRDTDVMSMANGVEVRVPYLDKRILEFVSSIKSSLKIDKRRSKPILLDLVGEKIEQFIWKKKKQGFVFPWNDWLRGDLRPLVNETLADREFWENLNFNYKLIRKLCLDFLDRKKGVNWSMIWAFIVLRKWYIKNL